VLAVVPVRLVALRAEFAALGGILPGRDGQRTREGAVVAEGPAPGYAALLRQLRAGAGLTQEELAEAASLSPRSISDLERGVSLTARKETARLLADALDLSGTDRARFEAAARGRALTAALPVSGRGAVAATRTLPRDIVSFTGRERELAQLIGAVTAPTAGGGLVAIHAIGGMAGIGKTTFAVHAAHQLAGNFPDGQIFLPLHAHTPGQQPAGPADALASLLLTAGVPAQFILPGLEARAGQWRDYLAGKKILLLLDDAAGHEQVRPLLPGTAGSLVLITSRRRLAALEDAAVISLDVLPPAEAAVLLARLAGRPELDSDAGPVRQITRMCGYLPLAIGMLAGQLSHHPAWTTADLAAELAAARDRLTVMHAENRSVAAAFELSYQDLTAAQQLFFRRLGLHPGTDIDARAAAALNDTDLADARRRLGGLYDQHLLTEPVSGRYRLHDLLREHARTLAAADDPAESDDALGRLLDYYLNAALASGPLLARVPATRHPPGDVPAWDPQLSAPGSATGWLETERANLHAAAEHAAASGRPLHAIAIPAAMAGFLKVHGHWHQARVLHQTAIAAARESGDRPGQARALTHLGVMQWLIGECAAAGAGLQQALDLFIDLGDKAGQADALSQLGIVHGLTDDYPAAIAAGTRALALYRDIGDRHGEGDALNNVGFGHLLTGHYPAAATAMRQALDLFRELGDQMGQADAANSLGGVQQLTGDYPAAAASFQQAIELFRGLGDRGGQAVAVYNLSEVQHETGDYPAAAESCRLALSVFRELGDRSGEALVQDQLGVVQRQTGDYPAALASHLHALNLLGGLSGAGRSKAYALTHLGVVQQLTGDYPAAAASHQQALELFRGTGERYGQAQVLNNLGDLLSRSSAGRQALDHYAQALAIARDLGAPLQQARALEGLGMCHLHDGKPAEGSDLLRHALTIYQRIGVPDAHRVQDTLRDHSI
jgi:tetratricopeptide (TPR) repeat protein/transcriptional regulator with XRE-family HTH domain